METPKPSRTKSSRRSNILAEDEGDELGDTLTPPSRRKTTLSNSIGSARSKKLLKAVDREDEPSPGASNEFEESIVKASPRVRKQVKGDVVSKSATSIAPDNGHFDLLKSILLEKLNGRRPISLVGLENEYQKVNQLVQQTVNSGEGNSMLIIGARGSGKSALVKQVLTELAKEQRNDFHIVRLNGFIHTDDKIALREIWRQLGKEMDIEDSLGKNYADTLSTLLALLSHPSELAGQESDEVAKAVIFVMDEFDLFASHPRQTLLYNLFDIAQSRKAPIAVLGLTTRIGVADNLEKRVKSRFSHRYVHLSLAKSFESFQEMCKTALFLSPEDLSIEEQGLLSKTGGKNMKSSSKSNLLDQWNDFAMRLFEDPGFIKQNLAPFYHIGKSVPAALTSFQLPISQLSPAEFPPQTSHFSNLQTLLLQPPDSKLSLLPGLTDLQLALLISAARLDIIHDTDTCNFNMVYAEYVSLASRAKIQTAAAGAIASGAGTKVWGRDVARGEWEKLIEWELIMPVVGAGAASGAAATAMVRVDVALEEIAPSVPGLDRVMERWCKHI
ncbi:origin recognition complex, subunit 4 [Saccharata proteae CBS 121410]|uniref:Origin recognition complex subunit 4 n=1 Tax=Saccharata proteae CBS 121410 TaxID=1314787 RepID=A0A9P4I3E1_9PEZI|nr:origin recognition complex, subunit 4 [Saccharata proteae CBS 121410]